MKLSDEKILAALKKTPLFKGVNKNDLRTLINLSKKETYKPRSILFEEGDPNYHMLILITGRLIIIQKKTAIDYIEPIATIGEIELLLNTPTNYGIISDNESFCLTLSRVALIKYFEKDRDFQKVLLVNLLNVLSNKFIQSQKYIIDQVNQNEKLNKKIEKKRNFFHRSHGVLDNNQMKADLSNIAAVIDEEAKNEFLQKRQFPRFMIKANQNCYIMADNIMSLCPLVNISMGGFALSVPDDVIVRSHETITGKIILPGRQPIDFTSIARWSVSNCVGFEFMRLAPKYRTDILYYFAISKEED